MDTRPPAVPPPSRRAFLARSGQTLGGGWLALHLPLLATLQGCAREAARLGEPLRLLTAAEGEELRFLANDILPADGDFPGAGEAGAAHFVDRVLEGPFADLVQPVREGLGELEAMAAAAGPGARSFASLSSGGRQQVLDRFEETPAFGLLHFLVVASALSEPSWGGNRDGVGWALIGMEHAPVHQPPFGWYDARAAEEGEG